MENEAREGLTGPTEPVYSVLPHPSGAPRADFGRFELLRLLGEGAMGMVFEARDTQSGATVALKAMRVADAGLLYRLKQEFRAIADVRHPNLVRLYELHSVDGLWFFTMERIEGVPLNRWVRPRPAGFDEQRVRSAFAQLWSGISAIHERGTLHRDLKPSNVLVTSSGRVVILDFGLASNSRPGGIAVTPESVIAGTPAYMAPEQKAGLDIGRPSDWYAMGVMLYEALTGERPTADQRSPSALSSEVPADLDALCQRLLATDAQQRPSGAEIAVALSVPPLGTRLRSGTRPFVGRHDELARLQDALRATDTGVPVVAWVAGTSGIGKTALVERFAAIAAANACVLYGRCHEREAVPYKALDGLIDQLCRHLRGMHPAEIAAVMPRDAAVLAQVFPVLMQVVAFREAVRDAGATSERHDQRRRAIVALKELLRRLALGRPLVIVIDDMHWGDLDSAHLLGALLCPPDVPSILLVGCYRAEEARDAAFLHQLFSAFEDAGVSTTRISIGPLDPIESEQLASELLDHAALESIAKVVREAAGVPFFIGELVHYVQQAASAHVALDLEGVLAARVAHLPASAQRLLALVALAARPLPVSMARALVMNFDDAIHLLSIARMVRVSSEGTLTAYHDRIREHVSNALEPDTACEYHRLLAQAFECVAEVDDEALAAHWSSAGDTARAVKHAIVAAQRAADQLAFDRAAELYATALRSPPESDRLSLLKRRADALASSGRGPQAGDCYLEAAGCAAPDEQLRLRARAAEMYLTSGNVAEGLAVVRPLLKAVGLKYPEHPRSVMASAILDHFHLRMFGVRPADRVATPEELLRVDVCLSVAIGLICLDEGRGLGMALRGLRLAVKSGDAVRVCRALPMYAFLVRSTNPHARQAALGYFETSRAMAEALGDASLMIWSDAVSAISEMADCEWDTCLAKTKRLAEPSSKARLRGFALFTVHYAEQAALAFRGDMSVLNLRAVEYMHEGRARGDLWETGFALVFRAWARLAGGESATTIMDLEGSVAAWSARVHAHEHYEHTVSSLEALARMVWMYALLYRGETQAAHDQLEALWPRLVARKLLHTHAWSAVFHTLRGGILLTRLRTSNDSVRIAKLIGQCIRPLRKLQLPRWSKAAAHMLEAGLLCNRGERDAALVALRSAATGFETEAMYLHASACQRRWGELNGDAEGERAVADADRQMLSHGVKDPVSWTRAYAPGFDSLRDSL